jgi:FMN reductase
MTDITPTRPTASSPIVVVVGNPKVASRTAAVATRVAGRAAAAAGAPGLDASPTVIELAPLGPQLFDWSAADVKSAVEVLSSARLAVVATPVYKATYTGLLKSFLDWFGQTGLSGVTVIPVMVGASSAHALAVEVHLRPLLVEIGATVPTRGLFVLESDVDQLDAVIDTWLMEAAPLLRRQFA